MVNAELTKVNSDKCRTYKIHSNKCRIYKSPFGQMQNLQKSIRTNAEFTKVHSDKCRTYKSPLGQMQNLQKSIRTNAELTKVHSDKCKIRTNDNSQFGQMQLPHAKQGVHTFRIHGVVYHCIGQLLPKDNEAPKYAEIYIHDGTADAEVENHLHHLENASLPELRLLQLMMHEVNPYVSFFKQCIEVMRMRA